MISCGSGAMASIVCSACCDGSSDDVTRVVRTAAACPSKPRRRRISEGPKPRMASSPSEGTTIPALVFARHTCFIAINSSAVVGLAGSSTMGSYPAARSAAAATVTPPHSAPTNTATRSSRMRSSRDSKLGGLTNDGGGFANSSSNGHQVTIVLFAPSLDVLSSVRIVQFANRSRPASWVIPAGTRSSSSASTSASLALSLSGSGSPLPSVSDSEVAGDASASLTNC